MEDKLKEAIRVYNKIAKIYSERNYGKILQFQLLRFGSLLKGKKVLDAGCGPGRDVEYLMSEGYEVTGIDLSEGMIEEAKKNVPNGNFVLMDFRKMKFKAKSFDGIWSYLKKFRKPNFSLKFDNISILKNVHGVWKIYKVFRIK